MLDITKIPTNELRAFAARRATSRMEGCLIKAAKAELKRREAEKE